MAFYERNVSGCSTNSSDSIKSRSSSLHSVANDKMGFEELSSKGNGQKHEIQRLPGMEQLKMQEDASTTDERTHRKYLSVAYIANNLCDNIGIPETQKLKDIGSWDELFLDKYLVGDSIKETGKFILDHDIETRMAQKRTEKDDIDQNIGNFNLELLHSDFLRPCVTDKHSQEHSEIWNPYTFFKSNPSSFANKILQPGQTLKCEKEREDIIVYSNIREGHEVDHHNTIKNNSQNSHTTQKDDDPFVSTLGSQKNEAYYWAPLDSSDEECKDWTDVKTNGLQIAAADSKNIKSSCDISDIFRPEERKHFSFQVLGGTPCYTEVFHSSEEKWNPETLQIKDHKSKDFRWAEKPEDSTETINNVEGHSEEAMKRSTFFNHRSKVKKDLSRDGMLDFQPLQEVPDQRNESEAGCMPEMEKYCEGNKHTREGEAKNTCHRGNCKKGQRKTELKSQRKESFLQMNSFCGNISPNPSENSTCKMGSDFLDLTYKSTGLCTNSDCILLDTVPQFNDESMARISSIGPRCLQGDMKENISERAVRSTVDLKSDAELLLRDNVNQKQFRKDKSHSDDSVLAKYYFYLNYLNKSKRLQDQEGDYSFFCQHSSEASICPLCTSKSSNLDGQQAEKYMSNDSGTSEISCHKDKRTEALKQQRHPEQQEPKALFASMNPKPLSNLARNSTRLGNPSILKDKEVFKARKIATNMLCPQRHWARASIAWSAYTHGEVKPRSQHIQKRATENEVIRKSKCKSPRCTSSGTESKEHQNSAVQVGDEINLRTQGDYDLLPWLLLPDELWLCIFSLLTHKDISQVSQVCHRFYQLAKDESLWKEIQLINCHCLNDDWLITLGNHHPQRFTLDHCHDESQNITGVGLKWFFQQCEGSLKELNIRSCSGPGFRGDIILLHASTFCHNLRAVDISWTGATDSGLIALVKVSRSLQCLSANGCKLTDDSVAMLIEEHGKRLKKLEIFGCHAVTAKCLSCVAVSCPNLKVLNIGRVPKITEDCLEKIVNCMEKLTSLNCTGLNVVRDHLVHFIVKKCPELECLILHSCCQVTDSSLVEISTHLPSIRYLDVSGCEKVTDAGVQALARKCHRISYLDLSSTATSKRGVCLLASFCFQTLECVKLSFCKNISLNAVGKLCRNCRRLRTLHLYGCCFVPDLKSIKKVNKTVEILYDLHVPAAKLSLE